MRRTRVALTLLPALVLTGGVLVGGTLTATPASAAAPVRVLTGSTPETAVVPNDRFTVPDGRQLTRRRVALPLPANCSDANSSVCDGIKLLNTLDGFDLQPRFFIPFSGAIDVRTVVPTTVYVEGPDGPDGRVGLQQLTLDPVSHVLAATTRAQLREQTAYTLVISRSVRDTSGRPLAKGLRVPFGTMSGTTELDRLRKALDNNSAYSQAGIASRAASFTQGSQTTVFPPTDAELISRQDQKSADPKKPLVSSQVPNLAVAGVGCYAFGSIESPQFASSDSTIPPTPSGRTPQALGKARIGFAMIVPAGKAPDGGWPVAVYGPGFTRSYFDLFVTSDNNAAAGIATVATDPLGHGFGPASTIKVRAPGKETTFSSYGRGKDLDGDGKITEAEGSQPTKHVTLDSNGKISSETPSPNAVHGLRGGLIQTTVDNMALVRAVEAGIKVPSCPGGNLSVPPAATALLAKTDVKYYGLSFGGIYGTMLMGTDPDVKRGLLNVAGGPIIDIARLSAFRPLLGDTLRVSHPSLANGGPGRDGFTESIPDPYDKPITAPAAGAMNVQRFLSYATWYGRPGGPEPYAPLERLHPRNGPKDVLYQVAFGDNTVPNITAGNIIRAGDLFDRVTYYRNDRTFSSGKNPHGFLADPTLAGREQAEAQLTVFLKTGQVVNPGPPFFFFEVPIVNRDNLQCLHYPNPQTGSAAYPPPAAGECPARPKDAVVAAADSSSGSGSGNGSASGSGNGAGGTVQADDASRGRSLASTGSGAGLPATAALALLLGALVVRLRRTDAASS